jgi:hypothetical protein
VAVSWTLCPRHCMGHDTVGETEWSRSLRRKCRMAVSECAQFAYPILYHDDVDPSSRCVMWWPAIMNKIEAFAWAETRR